MKFTLSRFAKRPLALLCGACGALAAVGYFHFHTGTALDPEGLLPLVSAAATQPSAPGPQSGSGGTGAPSPGTDHSRHAGAGASGTGNTPADPGPATEPANAAPAAPSSSFADAVGSAPGAFFNTPDAPLPGGAGGPADVSDSPDGASPGRNTLGGSPHFDSPGGTAPGGSVPGSTLAGNPPAASPPADGTGTNGPEPVSTVVEPSRGDGALPAPAQVSPVPEPESYTLLLAGLALIARVVARRRTPY